VESTASAGSAEISCRELVERLTEYLEDALEPADDTRVRRHLDGCGGCRNYLGQLNLTVRVVSTMPGEPLPAEVDAYLRSVYREGNP
jgi:predicted anti-sigma-YlaC factor YlaD